VVQFEVTLARRDTGVPPVLAICREEGFCYSILKQLFRQASSTGGTNIIHELCKAIKGRNLSS
jgi:hypothetical protein